MPIEGICRPALDAGLQFNKENDMQTLIYGTYILMWPVITLAMLGMIVHAVVRDIRDAKNNDTELV